MSLEPPSETIHATESGKKKPKRKSVCKSKEEDNTLSKRAKIANEILTSEESYVSALETLVELYAKPLKPATLSNKEKSKSTLPSSFLSSVQYKTLFSNIETIYTINLKFLEDIKNHAKTRSNPSDWTIGKLLVDFAPFFRMYGEYAAQFNKGTTLLKELLSESSYSKFQVFCQEQRQNPMSSGPFAMYLIAPIQRIPRYVLLLQQLIKHTEEGHPDLSDLNKALGLVKQVADDVEKTSKRYEESSSILDLEKKFVTSPKFVAPGRVLVRHGKLSKQGHTLEAKDVKLYDFFLFNNLLAYAQSSLLGFFLHQTIPIDDKFCIRDFPDTKELKYQFVVVNSVKVLVLRAQEQAEKDMWLRDLQACVEERKQGLATLKKVEDEESEEETEEEDEATSGNQSHKSITDDSNNNSSSSINNKIDTSVLSAHGKVTHELSELLASSILKLHTTTPERSSSSSVTSLSGVTKSSSTKDRYVAPTPMLRPKAWGFRQKQASAVETEDQESEQWESEDEDECKLAPVETVTQSVVMQLLSRESNDKSPSPEDNKETIVRPNSASIPQRKPPLRGSQSVIVSKPPIPARRLSSSTSEQRVSSCSVIDVNTQNYHNINCSASVRLPVQTPQQLKPSSNQLQSQAAAATPLINTSVSTRLPLITPTNPSTSTSVSVSIPFKSPATTPTNTPSPKARRPPPQKIQKSASFIKQHKPPPKNDSNATANSAPKPPRAKPPTPKRKPPVPKNAFPKYTAASQMSYLSAALNESKIEE